MSTDVQLPENLSSYSSTQRQRHHSANSDESRSGSPSSPKPASLNANSLAASALMLQQMYPHFQDRRLLDEHQSPTNFNAAALCDQFCNVINGFRGGPNFQDPRKSPGVPCSRPSVDATECRLIDYRGEKVAAFAYQGDYLLCLPQAFELFLKHLVGGLHTVYAKLKRLGISPIVCNVEQVRVLRGLGAIQPGVNRCKLLACKDFDVLYKDCTTARPGRPPGRASLVGLSGVGATSPAGHGGYPPLMSVGKSGTTHSNLPHSGNPFGSEHHTALEQNAAGFEFRREARDGDESRQPSERQSPQEHASRNEHPNHLKQELRSDEETPTPGMIGNNHDSEGMNIQAMLFKAMWNQQQGPGAQDNKGQGFPQGLALANLPRLANGPAGQQFAAMELMMGLQHNPHVAAAAAAYQQQLLQAASLAQHMKGKENGAERNRSRSPELKTKEFRSRESESPATGGHHQRSDHHQSRKSSFESAKKIQNNNNNNNINSTQVSPNALADGNALNLSSAKDKKRSRSVSSDEGSLSDGALSELSGNLDDDTSNYGDDDELEKATHSPKRDREDALSTSSRDSAAGVRVMQHANGLERHARDSNHSVPTPITLMQQHLSIDRTPPPSSPTHLGGNAGGGGGSSSTATANLPNARLHHHGNNVHNSVGSPVGSIEALLQNILGLLKVAEENARTQEQQRHMEKAELKVEILRERGIREQLEKQLLEEQNRRIFYQKRLRREKRCRRQMQEQIDNKRIKLASDSVDEEKGEDSERVSKATAAAPVESPSTVNLNGTLPSSLEPALSAMDAAGASTVTESHAR
ncbi:dachshund homolog 1-like [Galendromus occidentalis]|uniref:Dachshund homolog 1-like n=1 Tax=Galendromus occidentalis TaxID=34638 RepID=A0AAJ7SE97_9ACAR|nr:dachshund homolog 1-like [Galendromus occidentalis]